ncbi:hypothetical protein YC2023_007498 [Brassica napus]
MESLKRSLGIPERLGWEADPCTPSSWEGVTCITDPIGQGFVIYEIDLADKGLKGYISGMIMLLQNLNSLNLSSNCLIGEISSLVNTNLVKLDLSDNHLSGTIHSKLSSARLELLNLSKNQFTGWFPNELYSILYRGASLETRVYVALEYQVCLSVHCGQWFSIPNFLLVVSYGVLRMRVAFYISLFHFLRVVLLYTISDFSVDDSYALLRFTATEQILFVYALSAAASKAIYKRPCAYEPGKALGCHQLQRSRLFLSYERLVRSESLSGCQDRNSSATSYAFDEFNALHLPDASFLLSENFCCVNLLSIKDTTSSFNKNPVQKVAAYGKSRARCLVYTGALYGSSTEQYMFPIHDYNFALEPLNETNLQLSVSQFSPVLDAAIAMRFEMQTTLLQSASTVDSICQAS